ncbi:MAG: succinate dehydrogenase, hydrophobic membrane anchor protein [Mariprofundaceae bacterium]|nr:succinate dehydrogenase, hydrophobic membrane anchor protein [Mariprofundaceae bacterium]
MVNHVTKHVVREWYWQRLSAVLLALFLPAAFCLTLCLRAESINYAQFMDLMQHPLVQIWHSLITLSFSLHLWIGIKIILEDYISLALRIPTLAVTSVCLIGVTLWGLKIIWWISL